MQHVSAQQTLLTVTLLIYLDKVKQKHEEFEKRF